MKSFSAGLQGSSHPDLAREWDHMTICRAAGGACRGPRVGRVAGGGDGGAAEPTTAPLPSPIEIDIFA